MLSWKGRKTSSLKYTQYESEYNIKFLAFELKCIAFFQGWKPLKEFTFHFEMKDYKNEFYKS